MNYNNLFIILIGIIVIIFIYEYFFGKNEVQSSLPSEKTQNNSEEQQINTLMPTTSTTSITPTTPTTPTNVPYRPYIPLPPIPQQNEQQINDTVDKIKKILPPGSDFNKIRNFLIHGCKCNKYPSDIVKKYLLTTCEETIISDYLKPSCESSIVDKYLKPSCEICGSISEMINTFAKKGCDTESINKMMQTSQKINGFSNIELNEGFENVNFDEEYMNYKSNDDKGVYFRNFINENFFFNTLIKNTNNNSNNDINNNDIDKTNSKNIIENFGEMNNEIGISTIQPNKLYYGLPCEYIKDDCFYNTLNQEGFKNTTDPKEACLVVPCSYENTENEIEQLKKELKNNIYGNSVRVFMLNNTDFMVSKIALWKFLKERYGEKIASTMIPKSVDLTNKDELNNFKRNFDESKIYITKNNNQRQEGLEIHNNLNSILNSLDKYILVQELLQNPYLINGRKINLRVYCLIIKDTNSNILIQVYQDGFMYYTPELFEKGNPSFKKNITTGYIDRKVYDENPSTHGDFKKYLDNPNRQLTAIEQYYKRTRPNTKLSNYVFTQINHLIKFILETYVDVVGTETLGVGFQVYGADIAIDEHLHPMIMEINKGPDLTAKDGRDKTLKENMCRDILKSVGLVKPNTNNNFLTVLEVVKMNDEMVEFDNYSE